MPRGKSIEPFEFPEAQHREGHEHVIGAAGPVKDQRDPYVYGSWDQIIGRCEDGSHDNKGPSSQVELKAKALAADSTMTRDDKVRLIGETRNCGSIFPQ